MPVFICSRQVCGKRKAEEQGVRRRCSTVGQSARSKKIVPPCGAG